MSYGVRLQGEAQPELRAGAARILQVSLLALLLGGLGVALIAALAGDVRAFAGAAVLAVVSPVLLLLLRRGYTRLAMNTAVSVLLAVACVEVCDRRRHSATSASSCSRWSCWSARCCSSGAARSRSRRSRCRASPRSASPSSPAC